MCTELLRKLVVDKLLEGFTHTHRHISLPGLHIAALLIVQVHGT